MKKLSVAVSALLEEYSKLITCLSFSTGDVDRFGKLNASLMQPN